MNRYTDLLEPYFSNVGNENYKQHIKYIFWAMVVVSNKKFYSIPKN